MWPIHRHELKKFPPLLAISFLSAFNYFILKNLKDSLVVTAKGSGAEVIAFFKIWGILPAAILMTSAYTFLSRKFSREKVIYLILGTHLVFFGLFGYYLYPLREQLHPHIDSQNLLETLPSFVSFFEGYLNNFLSMIRHWTFTLFYIMAELWGIFGITVLLWGFLNETSSVDIAKRFYGPLGIGTNFSGIISGWISAEFCQNVHNPYLPGKTPWEQSVFILTSIILISGIGILFLYRWIHTHVQSGPRFRIEENSEKPSKKMRLSLRESFMHLLQSPYLIYVDILVLSFNFTNNLVEVLWKSQVKEFVGNDANAFNHYMGKTQMFMGFSATLTSLFLTGNLIRCFGWRASALISPALVFLTSLSFFFFFFYKENAGGTALVFSGMNALMLVALSGAIHQCVSRVCRYSIFDTTKELAFTPLSRDSQKKGKAAIDGVGSRLGKSAGAVLIQTLLFRFDSINSCAPYLGLLILIVTVLWVFAVLALGKRFGKVTLDLSKQGALKLENAQAAIETEKKIPSSQKTG